MIAANQLLVLTIAIAQEIRHGESYNKQQSL